MSNVIHRFFIIQCPHYNNVHSNADANSFHVKFDQFTCAWPTKSQATFKDELLLEPVVSYHSKTDPFSVDASARTNDTSSRVFSGFLVTVSEIAAKMTGTRGAVEGDDVSKPDVKRGRGHRHTGESR